MIYFEVTGEVILYEYFSITTIIFPTHTVIVSQSIYAYAYTQPRDPCPAYPVVTYTFNVSEDSGNFLTTINHMGNTSVNINGSNHGLLYDQVYHLTVEAINAIGSTPSEEILFCKSIIDYAGI